MSAIILPWMVGTTQIVIIVIIILLLFGGKKIPELMKGLGSGIKEFKDASKEEDTTPVPKNDDEKKFKN